MDNKKQDLEQSYYDSKKDLQKKGKEGNPIEPAPQGKQLNENQ